MHHIDPPKPKLQPKPAPVTLRQEQKLPKREQVVSEPVIAQIKHHQPVHTAPVMTSPPPKSAPPIPPKKSTVREPLKSVPNAGDTPERIMSFKGNKLIVDH